MLDLNKYDVEVWKKEHQRPVVATVTTSVSGNRYEYINKLLLSEPVMDGRKRLVWLVLAPYVVNIQKMPIESAIETLEKYAEAAGEDVGELDIPYHVERAAMQGLMPPLIETLKVNYPDLANIVVKSISTS